MAADLTIEPWSRLARLAPRRSSTVDLQAAADRYVGNSDLNAAAADMWEEFALTIDSMDSGTLPESGSVSSVSQDGLYVQYRNGPSELAAMHAMALQKAQYFRRMAKPYSVYLHTTQYNAWTGRRRCSVCGWDSEDSDEWCDCEVFIEVEAE